MSKRQVPIHHIFASDENGGIGLDNELPWDIREDWQHFVDQATALPDEKPKIVLIMGRRLFENWTQGLFDSLLKSGKPPFIKIVLSRNWKELPEKYSDVPDVHLCHEFHEVHDVLEKVKDQASVAWNIGGVQVYKAQLEEVLSGSYVGAPFRVYWTQMQAAFKCNVFYDLKTLNSALDKHFKQLEECPGVPKINQVITDPKSGVKFVFKVYELLQCATPSK